VRDNRFYFRQMLSGRDFATDNDLARQMVNFVYAIGDRATGECVLVDPAYDVNGLVDAVEADGMRLVGVLATHYHPDHVGGSMMGLRIDGIASLLQRTNVPIHLQEDEVLSRGARRDGPRAHDERYLQAKDEGSLAWLVRRLTHAMPRSRHSAERARQPHRRAAHEQQPVHQSLEASP